MTRWRSNCCTVNTAPSGAHWFGTDSLGRDVLSRVIVGARDILLIAPLATLLGTLLGTALGLVMGYFGGVVDTRARPDRRGLPGAAVRDRRLPVHRGARPVRQ